jgi:2-oxo-3-hexenedioate decarboxylase/2-keto-4-pentenoate hydratase
VEFLNQTQISELAKHLIQSRVGGPPTALPIESMLMLSIDQGYIVQEAIHAQLKNHGFGELVGHKIGCTTKVMQDFLSIAHPCSGEVFETKVFPNQTTLKLSDFQKIGLECEIAVRLSKDFPKQKTHYDIEMVQDGVGALLAAIELVEDRYIDYPSFPTPILIADDFFNTGVVLGTEQSNWQSIPLGEIKGWMTIDGKEVGFGLGADIMGNPLNALVWLVNHCIKLGKPLKEGGFVMLGSVVQTVFIERPARIQIGFEQLGEVSVDFIA